MGAAENVETLIRQLGDFRHRAAARRKLQAMGPDVADHIIPLIADRTLPENTRWAAIRLVSGWRCMEAGDALLRVLREETGLRGEAMRALETITGFETIGDDPDTWARALADPQGFVDDEEDDLEDDDDVDEDEGVAIVKQGLQQTAAKLQWMADEHYLHVRIGLDQDRKQQMIVTFDEVGPSGNPLATIYTECGTANPDILDIISRRNVTLKYGKFVVEADEEGNDKVIMRETVPMPRLTPDVARDVIMTMAADADGLEYELTHADQI